MKLRHYFSVMCLACIGISLSGVHAFEPVSIDEFFKQHPDERPVQPTMSGGKSNRSYNNPKNTDKNLSTEIEIIDQDIPITAQTYSQIEVLLLDRILGRSQIIRFAVGETKALNALFDVTISDCLERKTEFGYVTQAVKMRVNGFADSKSDTQKTVLYDDVFYIQMPGFKGFEHPIYDIKPIKCIGKPTEISLEEPIIPRVIDDIKTEPTNNIPVSMQPEPANIPDDPLKKEPVTKAHELTNSDNIMGSIPSSDSIIQDVISNTDPQNTDSIPNPQDVLLPVPVPVPVE